MNPISPTRRHDLRIRLLPILLFALVIVSGGALRAVDNGSSYAAVIAEKGQPASKAARGDVTILTYPDAVIKLQAGKVVSIKAKEKDSPPVAAPSQPAPRKPAARALPAAQWTEDYEGALARAKTQHSKVFLLFTGSDWCIWCQRLEGEILSTQAFLDFAQSDLVLVKLDFPRSVQQPAELATRNKNLAQKYRIEGFPTVIVLNSEGKKIGELGYQEGGPGPFVDRLKGL